MVPEIFEPVTVPDTAKFAPENVRLAESINLPPVLIYGTRPLVKPETARSEMVVVAKVEVPVNERLPVPAMLAKVEVAVNVGAAEKTKLPEPVVPVTDEARLAAVMVLTKLLVPSVATRREPVRPAKLMVPEEEKPVNPEPAPAPEISQVLELKMMLSPPSPIVKAPVVVKVPLALLEPIEPPMMLIVSAT